MAPPPEPDEDVDLAPEHRRYVLDVHARLDTLSHYELLGVAPDASAADIRRAYFKLVRVVHPDRYFGKRLGSYKPRLEAVFARMTQAYELLLVPEARARYDATMAPGAATASTAAPAARAAPAAPPPVDPATAARRQAALAELERRIAESKQRAAEQATRHAAHAARALAAGDVVAAAQAYREALRLTPDDAALVRASAEVERLVGERSVEAYRRQAELEERHGHWEQAAQSWQRVLATQPGDAVAVARLETARARAVSRPSR